VNVPNIPYRDVRQAGLTAAMCTWPFVFLLSDGEIWNLANGGFWRILLKKSKVASVLIFDATLKREAIDDSDNSSHATDVAYEFCIRR